MPDNRDFRVRIDLNFGPGDESIARALFAHAVRHFPRVINPDGPEAEQEICYVSLERCGHRLGESCSEIEREEVPS